MIQSKDAAKQRAAMLKQLRDQHQESVERAQVQLKTQQAVRRQISQALHDGPKIVPEIAETTGLPSHEVLWHITAMKKYGEIIEVGKSGEYYQYAKGDKS